MFMGQIWMHARGDWQTAGTFAGKANVFATYTNTMNTTEVQARDAASDKAMHPMPLAEEETTGDDDLSEAYDLEEHLGDDLEGADEEQRELALLAAAQNGGKGWGSLSAAGVCVFVSVCVCVCAREYERVDPLFGRVRWCAGGCSAPLRG